MIESENVSESENVNESESVVNGFENIAESHELDDEEMVNVKFDDLPLPWHEYTKFHPKNGLAKNDRLK